MSTTDKSPPLDESTDEPVGDDSLFLTVDEAAAMLRISRRHLYELLAEGVVHSVRLGRRVIIPRSAIEKLAAA